MMKMSMADQVKINLNPFQSVIDSLAIDPQRGRQLIHRLPLHGGGDYPPFLKVEGRSLTGRGTLTLMTRHQRPATIGQLAQKAANLRNAFPLANPQEGVREKGASAPHVAGRGKADHQTLITQG